MQKLQNKDQLLIKKFLQNLELNGSSPNTISSYKKDLNQFLDHLISHKQINDINAIDSLFDKVEPEDISQYNCVLYQNEIKSSSLARKISALRSFYKFLYYDARAIEKLPLVNFTRPKLEKKLPKMLTKNEINLLIDTCYQNIHFNPDEQKNHFTWVLMHCMLEFLYSTGCRITEALNIKVNQVIDHLGQIKEDFIILGKGGTQRMIIVNQTAQHVLKSFLVLKYNKFLQNSNNLQLLRTKDEFIFCLPTKSQPISRQRIFQLMKTLGMQSGIEPAKLSPHIIRHSIAIHLLQGSPQDQAESLKDTEQEHLGADIRLIQEFLGHKNINTTQIYLNYHDHKELAKVLQTKHPLNNDLLKNNKI